MTARFLSSFQRKLSDKDLVSSKFAAWVSSSER